MPEAATQYFGTVSYAADDLFHFPRGLPGFEHAKTFSLIDLPERHPLVFWQAGGCPELCFLPFPVLVVEPHYRLSVSNEDLAILELEQDSQPGTASEALVLALLSIQPGQPASANLLAPVVINLRNRQAVQAVRGDFEYSHRHPLPDLARSEAC